MVAQLAAVRTYLAGAHTADLERTEPFARSDCMPQPRPVGREWHSPVLGSASARGFSLLCFLLPFGGELVLQVLDIVVRVVLNGGLWWLMPCCRLTALVAFS